MDPGTALAIGKSAISLAGAAKQYLSGRDDRRNFVRELASILSDDASLTPEQQQACARGIEMLLVEPSFWGQVDDLLRGDDEATPAIAGRVAALALDRTGEALSQERLENQINRAVIRSARDVRDAVFQGTRQLDRAVREIGASTAPVAFLDLDDAPEWATKALKLLAKEKPADHAHLDGLTSGFSDLEPVRALITGADPWAHGRSRELWIALARLAEAMPDWGLATEAWERVADTGDDPIPALVFGSISAGLAGDGAKQEELFARAKDLDPDHPRVRLQEIRTDVDPAEALEALTKITPEDPTLRGLVACHRGMAYLFLDDLDGVAAALEDARKHDDSLLQVRMLDINLRLQRERKAVFENTRRSAEAELQIAADALDLRERLLAMERFDESGRLLMLAIDATALAGRRDKVPELLDLAVDGERKVGNGDVVLAEAALRSGHAARARTLLWPDKPEDEERERVIAQALSRMPDPATRAEGLRRLDAIVAGGGSESEMAAGLRVVACLLEPDVEWSEEAEANLVGTEHEHLNRHVKAMWLASRGEGEEAVALLHDADTNPVSAETMLVVYSRTGGVDKGYDFAKTTLARGVDDHMVRYLCAMACRSARDFDRMRAELYSVARDERAPFDLRGHAYIVIAEHEEDMAVRIEALQEATRLSPNDPDLQNAWDKLSARLTG